MSRHLSSTLLRAGLAVACLVSAAACGGELLRTGRAPVYLTINSITSGASAGPVRSDVKPTAFSNDVATAQIGVVAKDTAVATTTMNAVTLTRYHVTYVRSDGRNTPGVDVPFGFDGGLGQTIAAGSNANVTFELVRTQAKLEPPLRNMSTQGGLAFLNTIAQITFYGRDQNGNEIIVSGNVDIVFGDF